MGCLNRDWARRSWPYIVLNLVRACNIIVLTTMLIAAILFIVAAKLPNPWIFFADVCQAFVVILCVGLILSEIRFGMDWLDVYFPLFGTDSGFTWLGCCMLVVASFILGKLSEERFAAQKMGPVFWNTCAAAGILGYFFGLTNIATSWIFGKRQGRNIRIFRDTAEVVARPALPEHMSDVRSDYSRSEKRSLSPRAPERTYLPRTHSRRSGANRQSSGGFYNNQQPPPPPVNHFALEDDFVPPVGLGQPPYQGQDRSPMQQPQGRTEKRRVSDSDIISSFNGSDVEEGGKQCDEVSLQSLQGKTSPIVPNLARPDSALHPFYKSPPAHVSSRYSLVSHFKRFSAATSRRP